MAWIDRAAVAAPPVFVIPVTAPVLAALNVMAPPAVFPIWLLLMAIVATTAPVFETPVKPALAVPVDVLPRKTLLLTFRTPGAEALTMPKRTLDEAAPVIAQPTMLLALIRTECDGQFGRGYDVTQIQGLPPFEKSAVG